MARIVREGDIVRIFATQARRRQAGREMLIAQKIVTPEGDLLGYSGLRLYDLGQKGRTYTSTYQLGMTPARARILKEKPDVLHALFEKAGMPVDLVVPPRPLGATVYRLQHAVVRNMQDIGRFLDGKGREPAQNAIR